MDPVNIITPTANVLSTANTQKKATKKDKAFFNEVAISSVQQGETIPTKKKLGAPQGSEKPSSSFAAKIASRVRDSLNMGKGSKLKTTKRYPAEVNELIKLSKPSMTSSLSTKRASGEFRSQLSAQLQKLENEGKSQDATIEDVLRGMEDSLVSSNGSNPKDVIAFMDNIRSVTSKSKISKGLSDDLVKFYSELPARNQERLEKLGPSMAPRETLRTPMDVLTNLVAELSLANKETDDPKVAEALNDAKQALLSHNVINKDVKNLLDKTKNKLDKRPQLQQLCDKLKSDLPGKNEKLAPTQLYENIYGRAIDSSFVGKLVDAPPESVANAMNRSGKASADHLDGLNDKQKKHIGERMQHHLSEKGDARFWFSKTDIANIQNANTPEEAFKALTDLLRSDCKNGQDVIARPYLMVKVNLDLVDARAMIDDIEMHEHLHPEPDWTPEQIQQWDDECKEMKKRNSEKEWKTVPWMNKANANYALYISPRKGLAGSGQNPKIQQKKEKIGGITLPHQKALISEDWMTPATRSLTKNRADFELLESDRDQAKPYQTATEHGLTWVSGVSGSTNILLHQLEFLRNKAGADIDVNSYLMATLMFLVYDGGHSMQEVLFVANQLNDELGLDLDIAALAEGEESSDKGSFVADYSKFASTLPDAAEAMEQAVDELVDYFHENSYFSSTRK